MKEPIENLDPALWVNTSEAVLIPLPVLPIPAYLPLGFLLAFIWPRWYTIAPNILVVSGLIYLNNKGRAPMWVARRVLCALRQQVVFARPSFYIRRRSRAPFSQFSTERAHEVIDDAQL